MEKLEPRMAKVYPGSAVLNHSLQDSDPSTKWLEVMLDDMIVFILPVEQLNNLKIIFKESLFFFFSLRISIGR